MSIEAGRRHRPRQQKPDQVGLDGQCLHRAAFLSSVALAAGLLPADRAAAGSSKGIDRAARLGARPQADTDPLILVAEDNEINQKVLAKQLGLLGYRAVMVSNGIEALSHWRCGGHALLLTDLHMPGMDGYTLAAAVRAEEGDGPRLPILAFTANALRDEETRCRQAGMDGYLSKPVGLAQLKAAIDAWLRPDLLRSSESQPDADARVLPPPADLAVLAELVGDDPQVIREVLADFRASTARSAHEFSQALAGDEPQELVEIAHKLKSAARAIGATRLGQICADIEEVAAGTPRSAALGPLVAVFDSELRAVHDFLDTR